MVKRINTPKSIIPTKITQKIQQAKETLMEQVESLVNETHERARFEVTDVGHFKPIEIIMKNDNEYQEVEKFGLRIRPADSKNNSNERIFEMFATKKVDSGEEIVSKDVIEKIEPVTRQDIIQKLKDPNFKDELKAFVQDSSNRFLMED